jgi:uncharacterized protein (DUF885 family)
MPLHLVGIVTLILGAVDPRPRPPVSRTPSEELRAVADSFLALSGPDQPASVWPDLTDATRDDVRKRLDRMSDQLRRLDRSKLTSAEDQLLRDNLAEAIESSRATRVCRFQLWAGTNQFSGWHVIASNWARRQPLGTDSLRRSALATLRGIPDAIAAERRLLEHGLDSGYTAAAPVIAVVVRQLDDLLPDEPSKSPLWAPSERDATPELQSAWRAFLADTVYPAAKAYRTFLERDYIPRARREGSLARQRDGAACYRASLRAQTSVDLPPDSVMRDARRETERLLREATPLLTRLTGQSDAIEGIRRLRAGAGFTFPARDSILPAYRAMTARASTLIGKIVAGFGPESLEVVPYPEFQEKAGLPPSYQRASPDGTRPAQFLVNLSRTERMSVADAVAHEGYPGHHLQRIAETRAPLVHPVMRSFFVGGFVEGWGIYAERLGDEMGLYDDDLSRAGYLVHLIDAALACYLDIGYHTRGWTRQMLVDSMMTLGGRPQQNAEAYADRHAGTPGQIATYYIGYRAIVSVREDAQRRLGAAFDVRELNREVLRDGTITLASLRTKIDRWVRTQGGKA